MKFVDFCLYLEKLESTQSRNDMTVILSEVFSDCSFEEISLAVYMACGGLGPAYKSLKFQMAEKQVLKALELIDSGASEKFKHLGDLGLVAFEVMDKARAGSELSIGQVYKLLWEIAKCSGEGSQDEKVSKLYKLLVSMDALSAKFVVKIILSKLRSGFSDMTVLDALSWMISGDKKLRKNIEAVYNVKADLGQVAQIVKKEGKNIDRISVSPDVGTPVLMAKAERASSSLEIWKRITDDGDKTCALEYKLDGLRIQAHIKDGQVTLFSRGLENVTEMYPDVTSGLSEAINEDCIVEGEMIALDDNGNFLPFQETAQRKRKHNIGEMTQKIPLNIFLFDILCLGNRSLLDLGNIKRREILENIVGKKKGGVVRLVERDEAKSADEIDDFFGKAILAGTEGVMIKRTSGSYKPGSRDFNWIKYKKSYDKSALTDTLDMVIMGYDFGEGKRAVFGIGGFLVGVWDKGLGKYVTAAKIGTGLSDEEWGMIKKMADKERVESMPVEYNVKKEMLVDVWCQPKHVVEILCDEITKSPMHSSGLALRFPRLISFRDKRVDDASDFNELKYLFDKQKKQ